MVQPLWKVVWRFLRNLKIELSAIPLLGIFLKKEKILTQKGICTLKFKFSIIYNSQVMVTTYKSIDG